MISYSDALDIILDRTPATKEEESVPLVLAADRFLSREIIAPSSVPAADNSAMDGYALLAADTLGASAEKPVRLRVVGESAAGRPAEVTVERGTASAIMTGGVIPEGADAVAQIEIVEVEGDYILLRQEVAEGRAIRRAGEDMKGGDSIFAAGRRVRTEDIGTLATLGITNVPVRVKPKVAVLSTGSELVEAHVADPAHGSLRNSTGPALIAALQREGAETVDLGIVGDDPESLREAIETGLQYDVFLTTGGVSAGAYDFVQHLLPEAGVEVGFHGVAIKPGKPLLFGVYNDGPLTTPVFALPGNPVSSLVTFRLFVRPLLRGLLGADSTEPTVAARLDHEISKRDEKRHFRRGVLRFDSDGSARVEALQQQSSGAISSMSHGNCLIVLPEVTSELGVGSMVQVIVLDPYHVFR